MKKLILLVTLSLMLKFGFSETKQNMTNITELGSITENLLSTDVQNKLNNGSSSAALLLFDNGDTIELADTVEIKAGYNITPKKNGTKEIKLDLNDTITLNQHEYSGVSFDFNDGTDSQVISSSPFVTNETHLNQWFMGYRSDHNAFPASYSAFYKTNGYNSTIGLTDNGYYTGTIIQPSPISGDEFEISFHFYTEATDPNVFVYINGSTSYSDGHQIGYIQMAGSGGSYADKFMLYIKGSNYGVHTPISINEWHTIKLVCNTFTHKMTLYCDGEVVGGNENIPFQNNEDSIKTIDIALNYTVKFSIIDDFTYGAPSSYPSSNNTGIYCQIDYTNSQKKIAVLNASNEVESDYTYKVLKVKSNTSEISNYACLESGETFLNVTSQEVKFKKTPKFEEGLIANKTTEVNTIEVGTFSGGDINIFSDDFDDGTSGNNIGQAWAQATGTYVWEYNNDSDTGVYSTTAKSGLAMRVKNSSGEYMNVDLDAQYQTWEVILDFDMLLPQNQTYAFELGFNQYEYGYPNKIKIQWDTGSSNVIKIAGGSHTITTNINDGAWHHYKIRYIADNTSQPCYVTIDNSETISTNYTLYAMKELSFRVANSTNYVYIDNLEWKRVSPKVYTGAIVAPVYGETKTMFKVTSDNDVKSDFRITPHKLVIPFLSSAPSNPVTGEVYIDSGSYTLKVYDGSTWH